MEYHEDKLSNLIQIRAFIQVVACKSISKAAEQLFRTQSAITRSIQDLEHALGVPLFQRHANGMLVTDFGTSILPRVRRAIEELHQVPKILNKLLGRVDNARSDSDPMYLYNVRRLYIFISLCDTGHMQTVANQFSLTQPAVSAALKVLEDGAGVSLLERSPHGLVLTLAGREVEANIRRTLNELEKIPADIAARKGIMAGKVRVGALPLGRTRILPQAIIELTGRYPGISVATNESAFDSLACDLRRGDIDFIFGALRDINYAADIFNEGLFTEEMVILARKGHPLSVSNDLQPERLHEASWVLSRPSTPARRLLDNSFIAMGIPVPVPVVETGDLAIVRGVLLNSDMLAAVSAHQLEHEILNGELVKLPISMPDTRRDIGLMYRVGCLHSPAAQAMIDCLKQGISNNIQT